LTFSSQNETIKLMTLGDVSSCFKLLRQVMMMIVGIDDGDDVMQTVATFPY